MSWKVSANFTLSPYEGVINGCTLGSQKLDPGFKSVAGSLELIFWPPFSDAKYRFLCRSLVRRQYLCESDIKFYRVGNQNFPQV